MIPEVDIVTEVKKDIEIEAATVADVIVPVLVLAIDTLLVVKEVVTIIVALSVLDPAVLEGKIIIISLFT
jgi:hypothetical protein